MLHALPGDVLRLLCTEYLCEEETLLLRRASRYVRERTAPLQWCIRAPHCERHSCRSMTEVLCTHTCNLMLLYAIGCDSRSLLEWLHSGAPQLTLLRCDDFAGKQLCVHAATHNAVDALEYLVEHGCEWSAEAERTAAQHGHHRVLDWAWQRGAPLANDTALYAARAGHNTLLRWMVERQRLYVLCADVYEAVRDRDTLLWLRARYEAPRASDSILDVPTQQQSEHIGAALRCAAAALGDCALLDELFHAYPFVYTDSALWRAASRAGQLEVLRYLLEWQAPFFNAESCMNSAARAGHVHVMQWAHEQGAPYDGYTYMMVTQSRNRAAIQHVLGHRLDPSVPESLLALLCDGDDDEETRTLLQRLDKPSWSSHRTCINAVSTARLLCAVSLACLQSLRRECAQWLLWDLDVCERAVAARLERLREPQYDGAMRVPDARRRAECALLREKLDWLRQDCAAAAAAAAAAI